MRRYGSLININPSCVVKRSCYTCPSYQDLSRNEKNFSGVEKEEKNEFSDPPGPTLACSMVLFLEHTYRRTESLAYGQHV